MACMHPITAWRSRDFSESRLVFREDLGLKSTKMEIACGQCIGCRMDKARSWAARCVHEASLYERNCFVTLTYTDEHMPDNKSLRKEDFVKFMKRLRSKYPWKIRFFQCGEYGDETKRPHHHAILFNHEFPDAKYFTQRQGHKVYVSKDLSSLWPYGMHTIGSVTFDSACYVARYILKKIGGPAAEEHYGGRLPEYCTMSRNPGIGKGWYENFHKDLYRQDLCVISHANVCRPPAYYDKLLAQDNPELMENLKKTRTQNAIKIRKNMNDDRLRAREITVKKRQKELERNLNLQFVEDLP